MIYQAIVKELKEYSRSSKYKSHADEKDPAYKAYGIRKPAVVAIIKKHKKEILALTLEEKIKLAEMLITSDMGEEQTISFFVLKNAIEYFSPKNLTLLSKYLKYFCGWSKIDEFTGSFVQELLSKYPNEIIEIVKKWNASPNMWARRASVVTFTRKAGASGKFTDVALKLCTNLVGNKEDMVQKGVGWCLKDLLKGDKKKVLNYVKALKRKDIPSIITLYAIRDLEGKDRQQILNIKRIN